MRICVAQLNYIVGDFQGNTEKILKALEKARGLEAEVVVFSELAVSGYPPEDLLLHEGFLEETQRCLEEIIEASSSLFVVVGLVRKNLSKKGKPLFNSAAVIEDKRLLGFQDKWLLPTYDVFDEGRYFEPGSTCPIWDFRGKKVSVLICEDIWHHAGAVTFTSYANDPVDIVSQKEIDVLINIAASPYHFNKLDLRINVCRKVVRTLSCPMLLCCQVGGNDQLVFDGYSFLMDKQGTVQGIALGFQEDLKVWDLEMKKEEEILLPSPMEDLFSALVLGVRDYFYKSGFKKACLGISGGIDSAVVACIAVEALGKENVLGITMPSRYSASSGVEDAKALCSMLGIECKEISIEAPFQAFLDLLDPYFHNLPSDETEENLQARIRGMILMAFSNKFGYIVLSAGNKSEMAIGFTTLYGDLCGGLAVISDLTKRQVYELARYLNEKEERIPLFILQKEPSAELRPNQKDSDTISSYDLLDAVVEGYIEKGKSIEHLAKDLEASPPLIQDLIKKIHKAEYKRRQSPPGIRVSQKSFREGRKVPIVQKWE